MKVMIDTNIILDVLYKREDFYEDSLNIFRLCETKTIIGYVSTLSIANIIYIMRKDLSKEKINELFDTLKDDIGEDVLPVGHAHAFIHAAMADASSVIASRLKSIECWFNITGMKLEDVDYRQLTPSINQYFGRGYVLYRSPSGTTGNH